MSEEEAKSEKALEAQRKKAAKLEADFHKSYGKFCLSFELLVNRLRQTIVSTFHYHGLKDKSLIEAIIANDTADSVQEKCKMTILRHYDWNDEIVAVLKPIFVYIRELTNFRNNLVHGSWTPQIAFYEEDKTVSGQLPRSRSNRPSTLDHFNISTKQLQEVDSDCLDIWSLIIQIQTTILENEDIKLLTEKKRI